MKQEDPEGVEDWTVTFGDVMALLLTFFVLLFSFSTIDAQKWEQLVKSLRGEPSLIDLPQYEDSSILNMNEQMIIDIIDIDLKKEKEEQEEGKANPNVKKDEGSGIKNDEEIFEKLYSELRKLGITQNKMIQYEVERKDDEIIIRFSDNMLFDSGSTILDNNARNAIAKISKVVFDFENIIGELIIEGNTDNVPITSDKFKDNFELSLERALVVLYYIKDECDFSPEKLIAKGYGEYNPVVPNDTEENKALNRRTDLIIVKKPKTANTGT